MRLTKFEHACVLVEAGDARVLIDPGTFSHGFEDLRGLTAVLVTHQHPDHVDMDRIGSLVRHNPQAAWYADEATAELLRERELDATAVRDGDRFDVGTEITVHGVNHAVIYPDIPVIPNVGYLVGGRFFHPGDAFTVPGEPVDVLGLPTAAPWQKLAEAVDYLRAVAPRLAIPIHEAVLGRPEVYYKFFERLALSGTTFTVVAPGGTVEI